MASVRPETPRTRERVPRSWIGFGSPLSVPRRAISRYSVIQSISRKGDVRLLASTGAEPASSHCHLRFHIPGIFVSSGESVTRDWGEISAN